MKFVVVRGFQDPRDTAKKTARYAVVLGMVNGRVAVAPCTTYPARTGTTPRGSALLTKQSPAYKNSGFTAEQLAISIRDAGLFTIDSQYVRGCDQVGVLDTSKDLRLEANIKQLLKEYDLGHSCPSYDN